MRLSELPTDDARVWAGVALGDVEDDGGPVGCPTVALALECYRSAGSVAGAVELLHAARPGEPWDAWAEAAVAGWREVWAMRHRLFAVSLAAEACREEVRRVRETMRAAEMAREAGEMSVQAIGLMEEVLRG